MAWDLLQALWPNSWHIETESNYLVGCNCTSTPVAHDLWVYFDRLRVVSAPYGDSFDILAEEDFTHALSMYRVAMLAGEVSLGVLEIAALHAWAATEGGTIV